MFSMCVCFCFSVKQIAELGEIEYIENLPLLRVLNLLKSNSGKMSFVLGGVGGRDKNILGILLYEILLIEHEECEYSVFITILY